MRIRVRNRTHVRLHTRGKAGVMAGRLLTYILRRKCPCSLMVKAFSMSHWLCFSHDHAAFVVCMRFDPHGYTYKFVLDMHICMNDVRDVVHV